MDVLVRQGLAQTLVQLANRTPDMRILCSSGLDRELTAGLERNLPAHTEKAIPSPEALAAQAAGLVRAGKQVWCLGPSVELVAEAYSALRVLSAFNGLSVRLVSTVAGLSGSSEGAVSQMLEDIPLMRSLPGMTVLMPSDGPSARFLLAHASGDAGASYIRLPSAFPAQDLSRPLPLDEENWRGMALTDGSDVTICACGMMIREALKAAQVLARQGIGASVVDVFSPTHLPEDAILSSARKTGCVVTVEEGRQAGGMGEAVAQLLCSAYPVPAKNLSIRDRAGQSGLCDELLEYYGLSSRDIVTAAVQVWAMRRR